MIKSKLGRTETEVSRLGFGVMRLPLLENGKIDFDASFKLIDSAYKSGVNYFDTAYGYHDGESEPFLGEALKGYPRESFYLADKMPMFCCETESDVERIFGEQLDRCRVGYFDFYLMHSLNRRLWDKAKKLGAMKKLIKRREQGQIRYFGFSYHGEYKDFVEILDAYDWDFVQLQINYIDYVKLEAKKFHDELTRRNIPCVVMEPVRGGFLANLPEKALEVMGANDNSASAEWAFRWLFSLENTPLILSGMSNQAQVDENIRIFSNPKPLSAKELELTEKMRDVVMKIKTVPCTACGYCMPCPSEVDIPKIMHAYNDFKLYGNAFVFLQDAEILGKAFADSCTSCGACKPLCPQAIDIPRHLAVISDTRRNTTL